MQSLLPRVSTFFWHNDCQVSLSGCTMVVFSLCLLQTLLKQLLSTSSPCSPQLLVWRKHRNIFTSMSYACTACLLIFVGWADQPEIWGPGINSRPGLYFLFDLICPRLLNEASLYSEEASIWGNVLLVFMFLYGSLENAPPFQTQSHTSRGHKWPTTYGNSSPVPLPFGAFRLMVS